LRFEILIYGLTAAATECRAFGTKHHRMTTQCSLDSEPATRAAVFETLPEAVLKFHHRLQFPPTDQDSQDARQLGKRGRAPHQSYSNAHQGITAARLPGFWPLPNRRCSLHQICRHLTWP